MKLGIEKFTSFGFPVFITYILRNTSNAFSFSLIYNRKLGVSGKEQNIRYTRKLIKLDMIMYNRHGVNFNV